MLLIVVAGLLGGLVLLAIIGALIYFYGRGGRRAKYFQDLAEQSSFKIIDSSSYILKSNRFGDIIGQDFLASQIDVKIIQGIIQYNVRESIVFCDCAIKAREERARPFTCSALLHLRDTIVGPRLKFRRRLEGWNPTGYLADLGFVLEGDDDFCRDFVVSSDPKADWQAVPAGLKNTLLELKNEFPFRNSEFKGTLIATAKGWLILSMTSVNRAMLDSLLELDRYIAECLTQDA
jgi:hypothetical protein